MPVPPPPPPPPMPGARPGAKPPSGAGRGALLSDIASGMRLKKVSQINDRSAPIVGKVSDGPSAPPLAGAPPVPGLGRPPAPPGLAPPVPGGGTRGRSNSDTGGGESTMASAPQLGGLFAGGMPKLRKAGGVDTGADQSNAPYLSDPETSRSSVPRPPRAAPRPPGAPPPPPAPGGLPSPPFSAAPPAPPIPGSRPPLNSILGGLRDSRTSSVASSIGLKPKPPPPIGKKPPIPPPTSRKPSGLAPPPPISPARAPPVPGGAPPAPPPPPPSSTPSAPPPPPPGSASGLRPFSSASLPAPPPPPSAPRAPARSTLPPPPPAKADNDDYDPYRYDSRATPPAPAPPPPKAPPTNGHVPSLAEQAARNAFGRSSPAAPPPPPPPNAAPTPPSSVPPSAPAPPPSTAPSRPTAQTTARSMLDASSYTLTNGGAGIRSQSSPNLGGGLAQKGKIVPIHDLRWRFQDEAQFPRPRDFSNGTKKYRAGRGSSVPLDLSAYE